MPLPCSCSWFYKLVTHYNTLSGLCFCARAGDWQKMCSLICYGNVTVKLSPIQKDKSCWTTETFLDQSINHYNSFTNWIWTRSFDSCFVMRILCDWCDVDLSSPFSGWPLLYMCWCSVRYWGRWIHKLRTSELPWPCLLLSGIGGYLFLLTTSWCLWRLSLPLQCKYRQHGAEYRVE